MSDRVSKGDRVEILRGVAKGQQGEVEHCWPATRFTGRAPRVEVRVANRAVALNLAPSSVRKLS